MFPTRFYNMGKGINKTNKGRNPLKSGQCFLRQKGASQKGPTRFSGRNPLKSGQCFLHVDVGKEMDLNLVQYGSQSPQIGSMFPTYLKTKVKYLLSRTASQSPQIGSMFPTNEM